MTSDFIRTGLPVSRRVMNLAHLLTQTAQRHPEHLALAAGEDMLSWRDLERRVQALAAGLRQAGVGSGDRVLLHARNSPDMVAAMFAVFRLGAVLVPTNFRLVPDEVAWIAGASAPRAMMCDAEFGDHAVAARAATQALSLLVSIGSAGWSDADAASLAAAHVDATVPDAPVAYDDPCWFFFTSGTTGRPKAAVLTHGQMAFVVVNQLADLMPGTGVTDRSLVVAPLSHGAGIHFLAQVARGAATILTQARRFDPAEAWELVQRFRVANLFTVPTILNLLCRHESVDRFDHGSLRHVIYAGSPMYREDQRHALQKLGPVLVQYFGLGEVTGNITVLPPHLHHVDDALHGRIGTCGYARTGMEISVQDDDGRAVATGTQGEVCVCGPAVFAGYYNDPAANAKAFRDGWFRTGDLGYLDEQGFLYLTGRASDMYISGGSNIYPQEIEERLMEHPAVMEAAVVGVPDAKWGEAGIAACVLRPGFALSEPELLGWLQARLARYKLPRRVVFWEELPKSGYGKVPKSLVRARLAADGVLTSAR